MALSFSAVGVSAGVSVVVVKAVRAPVAPAFVRGVVWAAAGVVGVSSGVSAEVTVRVTGDRELRRLNRAFLGVDDPTDVLAFPSGSASGSASGYLGDIAVSWPAVARQAASFGHSSSAELAVLVVHGFLHLLGWDHASARDERAMWEMTWRCLEAAGVRDVARGRLHPR